MGKKGATNANLTPRQARFVEEFLVDLSGGAAAKRAGYTGTEEALAVTASRLRRKPAVAAAIIAAQEARAGRVEQRLTSTLLKADRVLEEVSHMAFADPAAIVDTSGRVLALKDMPESVRRAVSLVKVRADGDGATVTEVRFWDKGKSLELAMRHLGMLRDKVELSGANGQALSINIDLGGGK